eukprot:scaffold2818_cov28-Cyclotella_meneghiniana.AAC.3
MSAADPREEFSLAEQEFYDPDDAKNAWAQENNQLVDLQADGINYLRHHQKVPCPQYNNRVK